MSSEVLTCPACGARGRIPPHMSGKIATCLSCKARIQLPSPVTLDGPMVEPVEPPAPVKAKRSVWSQILNAIGFVTWLVFFLAMIGQCNAFTTALREAKSAPQEAAIGAVYTGTCVAAYVTVVAIEKLLDYLAPGRKDD